VIREADVSSRGSSSATIEESTLEKDDDLTFEEELLLESDNCDKATRSASR